MTHPPTAIERAFALAESGRAGSLKAIREQLASEGYGRASLQGQSVSRQLSAIIAKAKAEAGGSK
jgi:hypothetical protein